MEIVYCIPCSYGQHDEHVEMIEVPAPGVMGGARCPCKGECASRAFTDPPLVTERLRGGTR